jgi:hypothetical protein
LAVEMALAGDVTALRGAGARPWMSLGVSASEP